MRVDSRELPLSAIPLCQLLPCHFGPPRPTLSINLYVKGCLDCTTGAFHMSIPSKSSLLQNSAASDLGLQCLPVTHLQVTVFKGLRESKNNSTKLQPLNRSSIPQTRKTADQYLYNTLAGIKGENSVTWVAVLYPNKTEIIGVCDGMPLTWQSRFGFITAFCNTFFFHPDKLTPITFTIFFFFSDSWMYWSIMDNISEVNNGDVCCHTCDNWGWKSDGVGVKEDVQGRSSSGHRSFCTLFRHFFDTVYFDEFKCSGSVGTA